MKRSLPSNHDKYKRLFIILFLLATSLFPKSLINQAVTKELGYIDSDTTSIDIRPEHIEINFGKNLDLINWLQNNLSFKVMRQSAAPAFNSFISDSSNHMMFELQNIPESPYFDLSNTLHTSLHFAFIVEDIFAVSTQLQKQGCVIVEQMKTTNSGDKVITLKNHLGMSLQFIQRMNQMIKFSEKRFEHVAINVSDPIKVAKWFVDNLGMKIIKQSGAPSFGTFIGDKEDNFTFELYYNKDVPVIDFGKIDYNAFHIAFSTNDIQKMIDKLKQNGSTIAENLKDTAAGDKVVMLRNPWGMPIQLVTRKNPMLK